MPNICFLSELESATPALLYVFFWVILRRLNFICRRFGTLCLFHLHRRVVVVVFTYLPIKMKQTAYSETSAYKIQTPGNYPEENIQHTEHGESLKSRIPALFSRPPDLTARGIVLALSIFCS